MVRDIALERQNRSWKELTKIIQNIHLRYKLVSSVNKSEEKDTAEF